MTTKRPKFELPVSALERWNPSLVSALKASDDTFAIDVYGEIGEGWEGRGFTTKMASDMIAKAGEKPIVVNINSPGGDFFEGLAINTLLTERGNVTVNVVGLAASAASVIAMAGDQVNIAENGFLMIHNSWSIMVGNRHDFAETAEVLGKFDASMAKLYAGRTGIASAKIAEMMDAETWLDGSQAVEAGFADALLTGESSRIEESANSSYNSALRKVDLALASAGLSRSKRRALIKDLTAGKPDAAAAVETAKPCAGDDSKALMSLLDSINSLTQETRKWIPTKS